MEMLKVTRALPADSVSGKVTFTAKRGNIVQFDPATLAGLKQSFDSNAAFKLANGTKGFVLERDIIQGPIPLDQVAFAKDFIVPDVLSTSDGGSTFFGWVSARQVEEAEFEGSGLIDASITGSTAAGTELSTKAGKLSVKGTVGTGDERIGILRAQLAPNDPSNTFRILVEFDH